MACADRNDPAHLACTAARDATLEAGRILITTDFVVDETRLVVGIVRRAGQEEPNPIRTAGAARPSTSDRIQ